MTFKPAIWYPIAVALSVINLLGAGLAVGESQGLHAGVHVGLALAFGLWAKRLRPSPGGSELEARFEALELEVSQMRRELGEAQERLDFTERLLAQGSEARRVDPQR